MDGVSFQTINQNYKFRQIREPIKPSNQVKHRPEGTLRFCGHTFNMLYIIFMI